MRTQMVNTSHFLLKEGRQCAEVLDVEVTEWKWFLSSYVLGQVEQNAIEF